MKKILVPCDFSAEAVYAFRSAASLAEREDAEIHLLHVIELPVMHDAVLMPAINFEDSMISALKERAEKGFERLHQQAVATKHPVVQHILFGPTSLMILTAIEELHIDLVVMGTKGADGLKEVFIGSNAEKIVRSSLAPVLVVRKEFYATKVKNIVFPMPLNFEEEEDLIRRVKMLQSQFGATLQILWVNTPASFSPDYETRARLEEFANRYLFNDYTINVYNDRDEESGIIRFCHEQKADLLAMGTHGRKGLAHLFSGSLTEDVINHIDLPVWTYSMQNGHEKLEA